MANVDEPSYSDLPEPVPADHLNQHTFPAQHQYGDQKQQLPTYQNVVPQPPLGPPLAQACYVQQPVQYQQQPQYQPQYQQQPQGTEPNTIMGMRKKVFWIVFAIFIAAIVVIGAGVGAGISLSKKSKSYKPYPLETGSWSIQDYPPSNLDGVCANTDTRATAGCYNINIQFVVNKDVNGYSIANSPYTDLNGPLEPPLSEDGMWVKSVPYNDQAPDVDATCQMYSNTTVKLGKAYQFQIYDQQSTRQPCELNNGQTSVANQTCECLWFGVLTKVL